MSVVVYPSAYRIGIVRARVSTVLYADPHTNWSEVVYVRTSCDSAGIDELKPLQNNTKKYQEKK